MKSQRWIFTKRKRRYNENRKQAVFQWIVPQRCSELFVSKNSVLIKTSPLDPFFIKFNAKKLYSWVYLFSSCWNVSFQVDTRTGHELNGNLSESRSKVSKNFKEEFSTAGIYRDVPPCTFVNMDETAAYFETKQKPTVRLKQKIPF